jgi:beta-lactamase class C
MILGFTKIYSSTDEESSVIRVAEYHPAIDSLYAFLSRFDQKLTEGAMRKGLPGGAYVITYKNEILVARGFGNRENGSPLEIDENSVFRLGSVSKGFASVLTGIMVDQGLVNWDEQVSEILPMFKLSDATQTNRIELEHLLGHTTGLPRHAYTNLVEDGLSLDRIIPRFEKVALIGPEGEHLAYSNAAYAVIEKVLENRTSTDFSTLLQEEIFDPLGMSQSSSSYADLKKNTNVALPHLYSRSARQQRAIPLKNNYYNAVSAGGINASISDMGKWLLLLTGNRPDLISAESLNRIYEPVSRIPNRRFSRHWPGVNESFYGLGWRILFNQEQKIVYHGGYVNGFRSEIALDPEKQIGISILFNASTSYALELIPDFFNDFQSVHQQFEISSSIPVN